MITRIELSKVQYRFTHLTDIFPHRHKIRMFNQKPSGGFSDRWLIAYLKRRILTEFPNTEFTYDKDVNDIFTNIRITIIARQEEGFKDLLKELQETTDNLEPLDSNSISITMGTL